jgi:GT2 family glycosyltransferase
VIGCNLFVRTAIARAVGFDERLPLYGYLEDVDFSTRAGRLGAIQQNGRTAVVHLGASSGRVSGVRLGYSQVVNPIYLWRKNGYPGLGRVLVHFWLRLLVSNLARSVIRTSNSRVDRPGRLKGNLLAIGDLLRGRITPERIVSL